MSANIGARGEMFRGVATVLAALLAIGAPPVMVGAAEPNAAAALAALSVASEPAGANVFVDGQYQGTTPVAVARLATGEHRVRLVKDGYLENSRLVSLAFGQPGQVQVRLTPRPALQVEPETEQAGGGSSKKWLWIGLGAAAVGAGVFLATRSSNKAPTAGTVAVSPASMIGLMAVTNFTFTSNASDPDNGPSPLTYSWSFGDGGTGSGSSVSHTYNTTGTFQVTVTVSDSKASSTSPAQSVTVKSLSGTWTGNLAGFSGTFFTWNLTQSGTNISGSYSDTINGSGSAGGSVSAPNRVVLRNSIPGFRTGNWNGTLDDPFDHITGDVDWFSGGVRGFTLTRR